MKYVPSLFASLLLLSLKTQAQDTIYLQNPSFESLKTGCDATPEAWINRGSAEEHAPSVQPGCHNVEQPAYHGRQYLSLVARKNQNTDRISQKLPGNARMLKDSLYGVRVYLAYSENLKLPRPNKKKMDSYDRPAVLQLWGLNREMESVEMLTTSQPIDHTDWRGYDLVFRPANGSYDEIIFSAFYSWMENGAYNGNLLLDSISAIVKTSMAASPAGSLGSSISLINPSFEDKPRCCEAPWGWVSCGPTTESPPDVQPGSFKVNKPAADGRTYISLVVRDNETWESLGQRLSEPMIAGQSYSLKAELARAELLLSISRLTGEETNYATPTKLRIWGGTSECDRTELLAESPLINLTQWVDYEFVLTPQKQDYAYLILEAYFKTPVLFPYNGNLLIDDVRLSHLIK